MEDVLELYERPYNPQQPVVCLDEKPVVLHREVRAPQAAAPGVIAKRDSEYQRRGTANVFCAVEARAGRHFTFPTARRSAAEFAKVAARIAYRYPRARTIHLVVDNLNIHCQKSLTDHFGNQQGAQLWRRFTLHYTPKHASWLNQAEIEIDLFSRQCLGRRRIPDLTTLRAEARAWNQQINRTRTLIQWSFTRLDARSVFHYQANLFTRSENLVGGTSPLCSGKRRIENPPQDASLPHFAVDISGTVHQAAPQGRDILKKDAPLSSGCAARRPIICAIRLRFAGRMVAVRPYFRFARERRSGRRTFRNRISLAASAYLQDSGVS